ncbi:hypothetical protein AM493_10240 [Flavobacterium akiainvivens]|uniref:Serine acetyltransferase n=1 Tax=Flavobacterium akiainvivens TaxID=1202724 RepID=A0A0M8MB28_9FLAO|nr:serine acetyltransferase [Flavobacterium akiainvivens]KOS06365.1 hypothetical protein AM493_10240 [Flavobacterium akiainvivens]SFQ15102.1 serine O-acetyltransferase/putative colanic acid biosynthesis acetyltransferase WcaB [Flavobacterium akiainvivens]
MGLLSDLKKDIKANGRNRKGKYIVVSYRIAHYAYKFSKRNFLCKLLAFPIIKLYHIIFVWIMGVEIHEESHIGVGLQVWHGEGLIINKAVIIGKNALLRQTTTIGNKYANSPCPKIGDNVEIGGHTVIIGDVLIGNNVTIGAGSIVTKSIPDNSIAYGNPAVSKPKTNLTSN